MNSRITPRHLVPALVLLFLAAPALRAQSLADVVEPVSGAVVVVYTKSTEYDITGPAVAASVAGTGSDHGIGKGSVAEQLGLRPAVVPINIAGQQVKIGGDIILQVQRVPLGADLENAETVRQALMALPPTSVVRVKVLRDGSVIELVATTPNREEMPR